MLKTITLKNFVHFKDEIVIDFDTPNKTADKNGQQTNDENERQTTDKNEQQTTDENEQQTTDENERQTTDENEQQTTDENEEETVACNSLHIFVGANFCGKSTILELIRRCMTDEINLSKTNLYREDLVAYAFCKFDDEIISGIIAEPHQEESSQTVYKFFIYDKENETFFRHKSLNNSTDIRGAVVKNVTDKEVLRKLFGREPDTRSQIEKNNNHENIISLLEMIKKTKTGCSQLQDKPSWNTIENQYIASFPLGGIGIVQWTKSPKIKDESNYKKACERAEVISALFRQNKFNEKKEKTIFDFITYPNVYTFTQNNGIIYVQKDGLKFPLLKTSEGILEAKLTSLLLAYRDIKTLCLEEPDRGMHPQMIERLKTVLLREASNKTIIVVTHSPYFIDNITINNTHVFFRQKHSNMSGIESMRCLLKPETSSNTCSNICSCKKVSCLNLQKNVSDIETIRTLLFATKVLLVEGQIDKEVVQGIFAQYKNKQLTERKSEIGEFITDISIYQVISLTGCENAKKTQIFCHEIHLPCLCLLDLDTIVNYKGGKKSSKTIDLSLPWGYQLQMSLKRNTKLIRGFLKIDNQKYLRETYVGKSVSSFIAHDDSLKAVKSLESTENTYTWRHGSIEDAILSSPNQKLNKEIAKIFGRESLTPKALKEKLKGRLTSEQWKEFYSKLLKVEEIKRFIAFLKEKENSQTVDKHYCEPNICKWKFNNIVCVFIAIGIRAFRLSVEKTVCYSDVLLLLFFSTMFRQRFFENGKEY